MRTPVFLSAVLVLATFLGAQDAEDRLVEAELLEVSAGDLERAMTSYKAIASDEKAPAPVKARALLALGRSQRKAGQLEAAKKTLADLIAAHPGETETVRQAKGFLEELETGRARNAAFDWISDVEKSPEIQARVFDWTMALVGSDAKEAATAARQLLALGRISLPVVEQVLDASRDDAQRFLLAMIAVRSGRLERLAQVLEWEDMGISNELRTFSFWQYLDSVGEMPERERARILEAARGVPETPKNAVRRAALLLAARDRQDLAQKVKAIEGSHLASTGLLGEVLERDPPLADFFAERAKDRTLSPTVRLRYFDALLWKAPGKLGPEHLDVLEEQRSETGHRIQSLEAAHRLDLLENLAGGPAGPQVFNHYLSQYRERRSKVPEAAAWARILRKMRGDKNAPRELQLLAEVNDEAAGELAAFLANRSTEAPEYTGDGGRLDRDWTPSPRYAELMAGLLGSDDPVTLAIALEALALAPSGIGPEVLPDLERLVITPPEIHVREFAVYALISRFALRPETGPEVARIVLLHSQICEGFVTSMLAARIGRVMHSHAGGQSERMLKWVAKEVGFSVLTKLLPHVLALGSTVETSDLLRCYLLSGFLGRNPSEAVLAILTELETSTQRGAAVLLAENDEALHKAPRGLELLRSVATDRGASITARVAALRRAGRTAADWFEWPRFLASDDPLLAQEPESLTHALEKWLADKPSATQEEVLQVLESKPGLGRLRIGVYPRDRQDRIQVLEAALRNPETQFLAAEQLMELGPGQVPGLYRKLLETALRNNEGLHLRIRESLDESLIEPLVKLLEDPDPGVRKLSLETLQVLRSALEQKKEWQVIVEALKARKKD